jgi:hypothetical protein
MVKYLLYGTENMKKRILKVWLLFFCFLCMAFFGCEISSENPQDAPTAPSYDVYFDSHTPQTANRNELNFQGSLTGEGFQSCTLCFFIHTDISTTIWVLYQPSVGKIKILNDNTIEFFINVPKWLEFQYGPDTEIVVSAVIMETGYGLDIILANVVP